MISERERLRDRHRHSREAGRTERDSDTENTVTIYTNEADIHKLIFHKLTVPDRVLRIACSKLLGDAVIFHIRL